MEMLHLCVVFYCVCMMQVFACPKECTCSNKHVDCYGRKLREIPLDIPADTMKLDLGNNQIEHIDSSRFVNLLKLHELVLKDNQITSLKVGTFQYLKNLENLNLGTNTIKVLEAGVFDGLPKLKGIDLTENFIENIGDAFQNLFLLERLDLGSNKLKVINGMAFNDLRNLIYLVLPNNEITKIDRFAFRPLQKLSSIILTKNPLKNANALFVKNRQLSYIDLTHCALTRIPSKFPPSVQYLQLRDNNITRIKKISFSKNKLLGILVLDQNKIGFIEKGAFSMLKNLHELWLNGNRLTQFPSPVSPAVTSIYISKNKIQQVSSDDFPANSKLTTLSLKSNEISVLKPGTFSKLKNLNKLYLDQNKISVLRNKTFSGLNKLSALSLSKNFVTRIERDVFAGLDSLQKLELAFVPEMIPPTKIEGNIFVNIQNLTLLDLQLSPAITQQVVQSNMLSSVTGLKDVNLMDNNLNTLNPEIRTFLKNVTVIKIAGNMWHCDRQLLFLKKWMNSNLRKFFLSSQIMCSSPDILRGKRISKLKDEDFVLTTNIPQLTTSITTTTTTPSPSPTRTTDIKTNKKMVSAKSPKTTVNKRTTPKHKEETKDFTTKASKPGSSRAVTTVTQKTNKNEKGVQKFGTTEKVYTRKLYIKTESPKKTQVTIRESSASGKADISTKPTDLLRRTTIKSGVTMTVSADNNKTESRDDLEGGSASANRTNSKNDKDLVSEPTESVKSEDSNSTTSSPVTRKHKIDETLNNVDDKKYAFDTTHESKKGGKKEKNSGKKQKNVKENGGRGNHSEPTDYEDSSPGQTKAPGNNGKTKIIVIATCVSIATLIGVVLVTVLVHRQYQKNKLVYHRALQYRQDYTDVTFFVGEPVNTVAETDFIAKPKPRKRSDRGSTSSVTKEDITNELDQSMKVYTWDDEN